MKLLNKLTLKQLQSYFIDCVGYSEEEAREKTKNELINYIIDNEEIEECLGFNGICI